MYLFKHYPPIPLKQMSRTQYKFKVQTEHNEQRVLRQIKRYQYQLALKTIQSLKTSNKKNFYKQICNAGMGQKYMKKDPVQAIFRAVFHIKNDELDQASLILKNIKNIPDSWRSSYHLACLELFKEQSKDLFVRQEYPIFSFYESTNWQKERAQTILTSIGEQIIIATQSIQEGEESEIQQQNDEDQQNEEQFENEEEEEQFEVEDVKQSQDNNL